MFKEASVVTAERFAKGMTFNEYLTYVGSPENLAREAFGGTYLPDGGSTAVQLASARVPRSTQPLPRIFTPDSLARKAGAVRQKCDTYS